MNTRIVFTALCLFFSNLAPCLAIENFSLLIHRTSDSGDRINSTLYVNGTEFCACYENNLYAVTPGTYHGVMRYRSGKNFAQGSDGKMGNSGDFLLEVAGVRGRTDILLHGGNKASHSEGCLLLGPVSVDKKGNPYLPTTHPLRKLRTLFYGNANPNSSPVKSVTVTITDSRKTEDIWTTVEQRARELKKSGYVAKAFKAAEEAVRKKGK